MFRRDTVDPASRRIDQAPERFPFGLVLRSLALFLRCVAVFDFGWTALRGDGSRRCTDLLRRERPVVQAGADDPRTQHPTGARQSTAWPEDDPGLARAE